jgi:hypothetical protein
LHDFATILLQNGKFRAVFHQKVVKMDKVKLPLQQWAIELQDIRPVGAGKLMAEGPSIDSWRGITQCWCHNHKPWPAFYTSSVTENGNSDWINFCLGEAGHYSRWVWNELYIFTMDVDEHKLYTVNDYDDYQVFLKKYFTRGVDSDGSRTIDWVQAALDGIEGVWIRDPHCHPLLRYMDVEQTIWLKMPTYKLIERRIIHASSPVS